MAKSAHYCCDPRHHPEPRVITPVEEPCLECDPDCAFYGTEPQAKAKRDRILKQMAKTEGHID